MPKSTTLQIEYEIVSGGAMFSDGVFYTNAELEALRGRDPDQVRAAHKLKLMFGGRILPKPEAAR